MDTNYLTINSVKCNELYLNYNLPQFVILQHRFLFPYPSIPNFFILHSSQRRVIFAMIHKINQYIIKIFWGFINKLIEIFQ